MKGTTSSGFAFDLPDDVMNDMELFEDLRDMDRGDATAMVSVVQRLMGDQKRALYDHLRTESGRVPIDKVTDEILEIFGQIKNGPKS